MNTARFSKLTLSGANRCAVEIYHDEASGEWQVQIPGQPDATYHTDSHTDALRTAEAMLGDLEIQARLAARGERRIKTPCGGQHEHD